VPIVLGIGLLEVVTTLVLLALALTARSWAQPLADALGHVPGVGGALKSWLESGISAVVRGIEALANVNLRVIQNLFHGWAASVTDFVTAPLTFAQQTEAALRYLRHTVIPHLIAVAVAHLEHELTAIRSRLSDLEGSAAHGVTALVHRLDALTSHVTRDIERPLDGLVQHTVPALQAADAAVAHEIAAVLRPGIAGAEAEAEAALNGLRGLEGRIDAADLWKLAATLAAILPFVAALETEAGLGREECRTKVRGICTTDPSAWANLLLGLTAIGASFSIAELIALGVEGVGRSQGLVDELVGQ
jgi:hypothetical protein